MRCKNCNRLYCDGYEEREYLCKIFGYGDALDENGKRYIFENSKGEEGCKYTEKQLQKIEKQIREAELEHLRKEDERNREKLNKIEDELGCPLEVVFEALKEGIVIDKSKYFNGKKFTEDGTRNWFPTISLVKIKLSNAWSFECCANIYDLKDYKKTWWLPSDKEWKDE